MNRKTPTIPKYIAIGLDHLAVEGKDFKLQHQILNMSPNTI